MTHFPLRAQFDDNSGKRLSAGRRERTEPLLTAAVLGLFALTACGDDTSTPIEARDSGSNPQTSSAQNYIDAAVETSSGPDAGAADDSTDSSGNSQTPPVGDAGVELLVDAQIVEVPDGAVADWDRDGVNVAEGDCDDFNNLIYPGAEERSGDGLDSDCDGDELPVAELVWGATSQDNLVDAVELFDEDDDGMISEAEFALACARSANVTGDARPGIVELHASCAGSNSCRGMVYQSWNELYEHSCRGVNQCAGWSCVETAPDEERSGPEAFTAATCDYCHSGEGEGAFLVKVPPAVDDVGAYTDAFFTSRSDEYLRSIIAFGVRGVAPDGQAYSNMPGAYTTLSRAEMDTLIAYLRTMPLESTQFSYIASNHEDEEMPMLDAGASADGGMVSDAEVTADAGADAAL
jgi:mono/diheme cytochrome c family protein